MTDNEIIKALECCRKDDNNTCYSCPLYKAKYCVAVLQKEILNLINRQQTEIMETRRDLLNEIYALEHQLETTKAEAIKEFAERLKDKAHLYFLANLFWAVSVDDIDNLVKEMVGGE